GSWARWRWRRISPDLLLLGGLNCCTGDAYLRTILRLGKSYLCQLLAIKYASIPRFRHNLHPLFLSQPASPKINTPFAYPSRAACILSASKSSARRLFMV